MLPCIFLLTISTFVLETPTAITSRNISMSFSFDQCIVALKQKNNIIKSQKDLFIQAFDSKPQNQDYKTTIYKVMSI